MNYIHLPLYDLSARRVIPVRQKKKIIFYAVYLSITETKKNFQLSFGRPAAAPSLLRNTAAYLATELGDAGSAHDGEMVTRHQFTDNVGAWQ